MIFTNNIPQDYEDQRVHEKCTPTSILSVPKVVTDSNGFSKTVYEPVLEDCKPLTPQTAAAAEVCSLSYQLKHGLVPDHLVQIDTESNFSKFNGVKSQLESLINDPSSYETEAPADNSSDNG